MTSVKVRQSGPLVMGWIWQVYSVTWAGVVNLPEGGHNRELAAQIGNL